MQDGPHQAPSSWVISYEIQRNTSALIRLSLSVKSPYIRLKLKTTSVPLTKGLPREISTVLSSFTSSYLLSDYLKMLEASTKTLF